MSESKTDRIVRVYETESGEIVNYPQGDVVAVIFKAEGPTAEGVDDIRVALADLDQEIQVCALAHGVNGKCGDAGALSKDKDTGIVPDLAEKFAAIQEVVDRLLEGLWKTEREGGGPRVTDLAQAFVNVMAAKGRDFTMAQAKDIVTGEHGETIKGDAAIVREIANIRHARAIAKADQMESGLDNLDL